MGSSEAEENLLDDTRCARNKDTEKNNDSRAMLSVVVGSKWCGVRQFCFGTPSSAQQCQKLEASKDLLAS